MYEATPFELVEPDFSTPMRECIYCDSTAGLSDEHIVPYGLGGTFVLREASCSECAKITSRFELDVLRNMLGISREKLGIRSRRQSKKPKTYELALLRNNERVNYNLKVADHPGFQALPMYEPALRLNGAEGPQLPGITRVFIGSFNHVLLVPYAKGETTVDLAFPNAHRLDSFPRMVAKICYSFARACFPHSHFSEICCVSQILGTDPKIHTIVGGGLEPIDRDDDGLHSLQIETIGKDLIAFYKPFAMLGAPSYHTVIGRLHDDR